MQRTMFKANKERWCEVEIELTEDGRFTMSGAEGIVVTPAKARKMACEYWESFFEDSPSERHALNDRQGKNFHTPKGAAKYVIKCDGEYHGLDVHAPPPGSAASNKVYLTESCGQIRETINEWFPECEAFWKWHLNTMHSECVHQEARGETWDENPGAVCGDCGYKLGSAWTARGLPPEVIAFAEGKS
jgi:hypothetical protein